MSPTWVGQVSDPWKNGFHKKYKKFDNIAVYLIASLKSKWKSKQNMDMVIVFFIYVLEGNRQWNSWIFKMIDYLKGSIVKFKLNFRKALENKCESVWWWQISSKTLVCLGWGNLSIVNHLHFHLIKTFWLILICFPRMKMAVLLPILIKCTVRI